MARPLGTKMLKVRQAPNKEWGVWRVNEDGYPYLLITDPDVDEAVELANKLCKTFNLTCKVDKSQYY
jgi:hypothetical protein